MANPFPAHFDSNCQSCGDDIWENDNVFVVDGQFVCPSCAKEAGNVCDCGNFKKSEYDECFDCHNEG